MKNKKLSLLVIVLTALLIIGVMLMFFISSDTVRRQKDNEVLPVSVIPEESSPELITTDSNQENTSDTVNPPLSHSVQAGDELTFGGYDWRVLEVDGDGNVLIITKDVIEARKYHSEKGYVTWENCDLRTYLNKEFYNQFSPEEQTQIVETRIINTGNPWMPEIEGGNDTDDKIFLLSVEELVKYFGDSGKFEEREEGNGDPFFRDEYNSMRAAEDISDAKIGWWWLRTPGGYHNEPALVFPDGTILVLGGVLYDTWDGRGGVRPALWIKL